VALQSLLGDLIALSSVMAASLIAPKPGCRACGRREPGAQWKRMPFPAAPPAGFQLDEVALAVNEPDCLDA
jgi:hypothetical protein